MSDPISVAHHDVRTTAQLSQRLEENRYLSKSQQSWYIRKTDLTMGHGGFPDLECVEVDEYRGGRGRRRRLVIGHVDAGHDAGRYLEVAGQVDVPAELLLNLLGLFHRPWLQMARIWGHRQLSATRGHERRNRLTQFGMGELEADLQQPGRHATAAGQRQRRIGPQQRRAQPDQ